MIDSELLELLACPETKEPVAPASADLIQRVNDAIRAGRVTNRAGEAVSESIDGGLVRRDQRFLYPIRDDIPIMLVDEAIPLPPPEAP
jgi:uncharacterized protein YbaR (Trm112 family)